MRNAVQMTKQRGVGPWRRRLIALGLCAAFAVSACQPIQPATTAAGAASVESAADVAAATAATPGQFVIDVNEQGITTPASVAAGVAPVLFTNSGQAPHALELYWLAEGVTADEAISAYPAGNGDRSGTITVVFLPPDTQLETVVDFGAHPHYVVTENFVEQASRAEFAATGEATAAPPSADVEVGLVDFSFVMPDQLKAGPLWWQLKNTGSQTHEMVLIKLEGDVTAESVKERLAAVDAEGQVPPTVEVIPSWAVGVGLTTWVRYDLAPGKYLVVCRVPDWSTVPPGEDHWHKGMFREITVE